MVSGQSYVSDSIRDSDSIRQRSDWVSDVHGRGVVAAYGTLVMDSGEDLAGWSEVACGSFCC